MHGAYYYKTEKKAIKIEYETFSIHNELWFFWFFGATKIYRERLKNFQKNAKTPNNPNLKSLSPNIVQNCAANIKYAAIFCH